MKITGIFVLFAMSLIFENACAWWAAVARGMEPVILSVGAAFAALGLKDQPNNDTQLFDVKGWFKSKFESEKIEKTIEDLDDVEGWNTGIPEKSAFDRDYEKASPEDRIKMKK